MNRPTNMSPGGGEILPCAACEITSCQISMKEVAYFSHPEREGGEQSPSFLRTGLPGNAATPCEGRISYGLGHPNLPH